MATKYSPDQAGPSVPLDAAAVFGASVQLPAFDKAEPDAWFVLAEANFNLRKVTDSHTKFWYVLSKFDSQTLRKLATFLKEPRGEDPYKELRDMLCLTYEPPLEQKLNAFLSLSSIGDERPSEFALEIRRLASAASMDDMMKRVFVRCLPAPIVTAITGSLSGSFQAVATAADRAWMASSAGSAPTAAVTAVTSTATQKGNKRGGRQKGARASGIPTSTVTICSFHKKFGDAARRCTPACSRWGKERPREPPRSEAQAARVYQVEEAVDGEDANVGTASENW